MFDDKVILCGSSSYEKIFYFNPEFDSLPKQIKDELQIMCVLFTADVGGILTMEFDEEGNVIDEKTELNEGEKEIYDKWAEYYENREKRGEC